jgi:hypothetical protein
MAIGSAGTMPKSSDSVPADDRGRQDDDQCNVKRMGMEPSTRFNVLFNALRARRPDGIGFNFSGKVQEGYVDIE